jgi:hypothetical protein
VMPDGSLCLVEVRLDLDRDGQAGWVWIDGQPLAVVRSRGRWGNRTGGWIFQPPCCGRPCRALYAAPDIVLTNAPPDGASSWACRLCKGLSYSRERGLLLADQRASKATPRRPGEPLWRWKRRVAKARKAWAGLEALAALA